MDPLLPGEDDENEEVDEWLQNTELLSLWPPEQFYDLQMLGII